ncbi:hypothetical protein ARTHRO9AX_80188 [Arthrobacter sp. 9AX]|nr:hypothetical protein ARTHRO9AX_80188 [Arthrobacter sp. 9AX]
MSKPLVRNRGLVRGYHAWTLTHDGSGEAQLGSCNTRPKSAATKIGALGEMGLEATAQAIST